MASIVSIALVLAAASGCGSDSEDSGKSGVFRNKPVSGLTYSTASFSGTTDASGKFMFREGETVTFMLGEVVLGSFTAMEVLTPFEISGAADATTASKIETAIGISQLLHSLDTTAGGNIEIDAEVAAQLSVGLDFSDESAMRDALAEIDPDLVLMARSEACASLQQALADLGGAAPALKAELDSALAQIGDARASIVQAIASLDDARSLVAQAELAHQACVDASGALACTDTQLAVTAAATEVTTLQAALDAALAVVDPAAASVIGEVDRATALIDSELAACAGASTP